MKGTFAIRVSALLLGLSALSCAGEEDDGEAPAGGASAGGGSAVGGASGGDGGLGGSVNGGTGGEMLTDVPFEGDIAPLPAGAELDDQTYLPVPSGGVWRYRKRSKTPEMPEPVTQGGESELDVRPDPDNPERQEVVRTTITIFDLPPSGDAPGQKVHQTLKETLEVRPFENQVGPKIRFKRLDIEEREVGTGKFVRTLSRVFTPPYTLMEDAWRVGLIAGQITEHPSVTETIQEHGDEMPREQMYIGDVRVEASDHEETLLMEGRYREKVRQVEVFDDVTQQSTRTIWVQLGVGIVQWTYRDATNLTFTLVESNVEPAAAP